MLVEEYARCVVVIVAGRALLARAAGLVDRCQRTIGDQGDEVRGKKKMSEEISSLYPT
jgi:hypothetical protein